MSGKKGPKGFKRWILNNGGKKVLEEFMEDSVKKFNCILADHLVEDWEIVYRDGMSGESLRVLYRWLEEKHPEIMKEWQEIHTRGRIQ